MVGRKGKERREGTGGRGGGGGDECNKKSKEKRKSKNVKGYWMQGNRCTLIREMESSRDKGKEYRREEEKEFEEM